MIDRENLAEQYRHALEDYLGGAGEVSLQRAYVLGREALDHGMGIVEMVALQHRVLTEVLSRQLPEECGLDNVRRTEAFFVESLSPFELTHRGFQELNAALRLLNERLNDKLEDVARKIAVALHDEAWQLLSVVHVDLELAGRNLSQDAMQHLERVKCSLREHEQHLRRLSHEIRPRVLDVSGVVSALKFLAEGISERTGIPITVEGPIEKRFPAQIETNLYRIVQEALTNLSRHAHANRASVLVRCGSGQISCSVRDDGVGFDVQGVRIAKNSSGLGLLSIEERVAALGGRLQIHSSPSRGTEILVTIPLQKTLATTGG